MGGVCFAELARARASVADVVVVNLHLYGLNIASGADVRTKSAIVKSRDGSAKCRGMAQGWVSSRGMSSDWSYAPTRYP